MNNGQNHDLQSLLSSPDCDYLIRNNGDQQKHSMESNPRRSFHQKTVSSETMNWRHFLVIVVEDSIVDKKLGIPFVFAKRYGNELSDVVSITIPNGRVWKLGIGKNNESIWLDNGWPEFVEFYSIRHGNILVFTYKGVSCFDVRIYNIAACEVEYPYEELEKETRTVSGSHGHGTYLSTSEEAENPIHAAKMFKTAGPSFTMAVQSYNIKHQIGYLPKKFSDHLKCSRFLELQLQVSDGSAWSVRAATREKCSGGGLNFSTGFSDFLKDNNLVEGDAVVFELIVSEPVVLKASIFRASDFRSGQ